MINPDQRYVSKQIKLNPFTMMKWIGGKIFFSKRKENTKYFKFLNKESLVVPSVGNIRVSWLGHSSVLIQLANGKTIMIDPIFRKRSGGVVPRIVGVPIASSGLPQIDICLISHDHYDHCDIPALASLNIKNMVSGKEMKSVFNKKCNVVELDWWESAEIDNLKITFIPAKHWSGRAFSKRNARLWGGFVIETKTHTIYYSGDTAFCDVAELVHERFPKIDIAIIPVGAYKPDFITEFHVTPEQAFQFFQTLKPKYFLPVHWGTYDLSDESVYEPIERIQKAFADANASGLLDFCVGETKEI